MKFKEMSWEELKKDFRKKLNEYTIKELVKSLEKYKRNKWVDWMKEREKEVIKKIIISVLIMAGIVLAGWLLKDVTISNNYAENERFIQIYNQYSKDGFRIYYDKETKVMYLISDIYKGGGITVLVDQEGKPLLYEGE